MKWNCIESLVDLEYTRSACNKMNALDPFGLRISVLYPLMQNIYVFVKMQVQSIELSPLKS